MAGLRAVASPGHTPGHLIYYLTASEVPVIFTGDAAKNRAELLSGDVIDTEDRESSVRSVQEIWKYWKATPGTLVIPGHDLPMKLDAAGQPVYVAEREASIMTWFAESLAHTTLIDLCCTAPGKLFTSKLGN
jgi:N-acyl homoserine lactone hydrolase